MLMSVCPWVLSLSNQKALKHSESIKRAHRKQSEHLCQSNTVEPVNTSSCFFVVRVILFRTHNSKSLEEENLRLFIEKSKEMLGIKKIFGQENEKVFRNPSNFPIVLNAIAQLSQKSERSKSKLKPKVNVNIFKGSKSF